MSFLICTVTYNRAPCVRACIESIFMHTRMQFELYIYDNASHDETVDYLKTLTKEKSPNCEKLEIFFSDKNNGKIEGMNWGMRHSKVDKDIICAIDSDIVVSPDWDVMLHTVRNKVEIEVIGPSYTSGHGWNDPIVKYPDDKPKEQNGERVTLTNGLPGGCVMFSGKTLARTKGYGHQAGGAYGGVDSAFNIRCRELGLEMGHTKKVIVQHPDDSKKYPAYQEYKKMIHKAMKTEGLGASKKFRGFWG